MAQARTVTIAATQMTCSWDLQANVNTACDMIREASARGAQIVLIQELFETPYFCIERDPAYFRLAREAADHPMLRRMSALAAELGVVLPVSFFERCNNAYFNTVAMIDADGRDIGLYRKSHIPDGYGYQEKFYFSPGDTGFRVFETRYAKIGVAICWDQWFPEAARALALAGAEMLLYPTAIGSEPTDPSYDSKDHWQRVMQGHAAANMVPVVASNRIGTEAIGATELTFYGSSFITDPRGAKLAEAGRTDRDVLVATVDLDTAIRDRASWGLYRDRRPDLYKAVLTRGG